MGGLHAHFTPPKASTARISNNLCFGNENATSSCVTLSRAVNRRFFLFLAPSFGTSLLASSSSSNETVYRFTSGDCNIRMSVEFFDNYSSKGFWFRERMSDRRFCLSDAGGENRNCLSNFTGAIAIARYQIRCRARPAGGLRLMERVRTIDQDSRLVSRLPFERTIELQGGVASDIQAFGYQPDSSSSSDSPGASDPWCLLRQDLYLPGEASSFVVIHWKHTLSAIRLFDVIPGTQTRLVAEPGVPDREIK